MKKQLIILQIAVISVFAPACNKNSMDEINVTVTNSQTYHYDFGICGDEEGVAITKMAEHYEICRIVRDSTTFFCSQLEYKPAAGYVGSDVIEVETNTGSDGAGGGELNTITFNFTVTD